MGDDTNFSIVVTSHGMGKVIQSKITKELCLMMWFYILNWEMRTHVFLNIIHYTCLFIIFQDKMFSLSIWLCQVLVLVAACGLWFPDLGD